MEVFYTYLIKSVISLGALYLAYSLFFSREAYFAFSRYFLLAVVLLTLFLPLIPYHAGIFIPESPMINSNAGSYSRLAQFNLDEVIIRAGSEKGFNIRGVSLAQIFILIYLMGVIFRSVQFGYRIIRLTMMIGKSEVIEKSGLKYVLLEDGTPTFSFLNYVFINQSLIKSQEDLNTILAHEHIHARQGHTYDLFFAELLTLVQWFNPLAYLLKKAMRDNHEYLSDNAVVSHMADPEKYQLLLLEHSGSISSNILTHQFSYSLLKRRLRMINKPKRPLRIGIGILFTGIIMGMVLFACSSPPENEVQPQTSRSSDLKKDGHTVVEIQPEKPGGLDALMAYRDENGKWPDEIKVVSETASEQSSLQEDDSKVFTVVEQMPEFPGGMEALMKFLGSNIQYPEKAKNDKIDGRVFVNFIVEKDGHVSSVRVLRGIGGGCDEEAIRVVSSMPVWKPGKQSGEAVRVSFNLPIRFALK